jgi:hypothetical protein
MRRGRHLTAVTVLWLVCQACAFAAMPFAACRSHDHSADIVSDPSQASGVPCPMHHHDGGHSHASHPADAPDDGPSFRCQCRISDSTLAALIIGSGMLPPAFVLPFEPLAEAVSIRPSAGGTRSAFPDTPPPRL